MDFRRQSRVCLLCGRDHCAPLMYCARLRSGDLILEVNGQRVDEATIARALVGEDVVGSVVQVPFRSRKPYAAAPASNIAVGRCRSAFRRGPGSWEL
eukprot:679631-Rhodomonas_salina.1